MKLVTALVFTLLSFSALAAGGVAAPPPTEVAMIGVAFFGMEEARWMVATVLVLIVALGFIGAWKLVKREVVRYGLVKVLLFVAISVPFMHVAGDKTNRVDNGELRMENCGVPRSGSAIFHSQFSILNSPFAFTAIDKKTNRVDIALSWTTNYVFSAVGLYHRPSLVSNDFSRIDIRTDVANATNCAWTITDPSIVTNKEAFFGARGFLADDDSDADGVVAQREIALELDPDLADTDGDFLSDGEELGYAEVLPEGGFLWLEIPHFMNYIVGGSDASDCAYIDEDLDVPFSVNGTEFRSIHATLDGHVYLAPQAGMGPSAVDWCDPLQGVAFGLSCLAEGCVSVFGCNADMGARKTTWGSGLYFDTVSTNGVVYDVVEFRNIGLITEIGSSSPTLTYEVIFPRGEPNVVYVSYLSVDPSVAAMDMSLGVQCDGEREFGDTNRYYTVQGPPPAEGRTVKYRIGTCTSPLVADFDEYGIPLGYPRVTAFDADGDGLADPLDPEPIVCGGDFHGQSDAWVLATFTNAAEILSVGYPQWVDAQVGVGLTNGLYKLTVSVTNAPANPVLISVGDCRVVVTNVGDSVFLLEKGIDYEYRTSPFLNDIVYSVADDAAHAGIPLRSGGSGSGAGTWSTDGGYGNTPQTAQTPGLLWWMPIFFGSPDVSHIWPNDDTVSFSANLTDVGPGVSASYSWTASEGLTIQSPSAQTTQISIDSMPSWAQASVSVSATIGGHTLNSHLDGLIYGTNATPQVHLSLDIPDAILLNSNDVDAAKIVPVGWAFSSDAPTSGTVRVTCLSGNGKFSAPGFLGTRMVSDAFSIERTIEGIETSDLVGDVVFRMQFTSGGRTNAIEKAMTVVRIGDVLIPSAPADGLVVLTNTPVALQLECEPQGAGVFLSTTWHARRLKSDGSFDPWQLAAYSHPGAGLEFTPLLGGIYQVRAVSSVVAGGSDVRFYRWDEDENHSTGLKKCGDIKAFGVCDEQWQIDLRNCAKMMIGNTAYAYGVDVQSAYGFSKIPAPLPKCNIFTAHMIVSASLVCPVQHTGRYHLKSYPPLANDWESATELIDHWHRLPDGTHPQPGFVAAISGNPMGHCGILDFDGMGISAQGDRVTRLSHKIQDLGHYREYKESED